MTTTLPSAHPIQKVLIANRGEIALRILRACKDMGLKTVAVHSQADQDAMHVRLADESVCIGPASSAKSYLNIPAILAAAELTGADAVHPGFGFLSENADFADMVVQHGMIFIGPSAKHIRMMGHKVVAKETAQKMGLPLIPGSDGMITDLDQAIDLAETIGYPVLLKAASGGGGKGMSVVWKADDMKTALDRASAEAMASFGHGGVYMEKYLHQPRHIEFQVLGDHHGNVICLGERECSIQRNYQKIWEEAPCSILSDTERQTMMNKVIQSMKGIGYTNAGTVEFLYVDGQFYFIEMNTRIQVEHPVTEMVTGIDIVKQQIHIAQGHPLSLQQSDIKIQGHAIECRINAEDPDTFLPSPGQVDAFLPPSGPFVRFDSGLFPGYTIPPYYDSLIGKLIAHGHDRTEAIARMKRALGEILISGPKTLVPLHKNLCDDCDVMDNNVHVKWLEEKFLCQQKKDCDTMNSQS